jgi:hypothetical protein
MYALMCNTKWSNELSVMRPTASRRPVQQRLWLQPQYSHVSGCTATSSYTQFRWVVASFVQIRTAETVMPKSNFLCRLSSFTDWFGWNSVWDIDTWFCGVLWTAAQVRSHFCCGGKCKNIHVCSKLQCWHHAVTHLPCWYGIGQATSWVALPADFPLQQALLSKYRPNGSGLGAVLYRWQ